MPNLSLSVVLLTLSIAANTSVEIGWGQRFRIEYSLAQPGCVASSELRSNLRVNPADFPWNSTAAQA